MRHSIDAKSCARRWRSRESSARVLDGLHRRRGTRGAVHHAGVVLLMSLDLVKIERVDPIDTAKPGVTSYTITAITVEEYPRTVQYQTISEKAAAMCYEAQKTRQGVWVTWRDGSYRCKDVTRTELDQTIWSVK